MPKRAAAALADLAKASPKRLSLPSTAWGSPSPEAAVRGAGGPGRPEGQQQQLAANRHSLVEKLGELVSGRHALARPFPCRLSAAPRRDARPTAPASLRPKTCW